MERIQLVLGILILLAVIAFSSVATPNYTQIQNTNINVKTFTALSSSNINSFKVLSYSFGSGSSFDSFPLRLDNLYTSKTSIEILTWDIGYVNNGPVYLYPSYYNSTGKLNSLPTVIYNNNAYGNSYYDWGYSLTNLSEQNNLLSTLYQNYTTAVVNQGGAGYSADGEDFNIYFIQTNNTLINYSAYGLKYNSTSGILTGYIPKGEKIIFVGQNSFAVPSVIQRTNLSSQSHSYIFIANVTQSNVYTFSVGTGPMQLYLLAPSTLSFSSIFSYISPSGTQNACYYNNPYTPLLWINGTKVTVQEGTPITINTSGGLDKFDSVYGFGGHNYQNGSGATYQLLPTAAPLNKPDLWITVPHSVSWINTVTYALVQNGGGFPTFGTIPFNTESLAAATLFYSNQTTLISKVGQIQTATDYLSAAIEGATYNVEYSNKTFAQQPVFNFTGLLSNSSRILYTNITLDLRIPTNFSTSNTSQIVDPNLTINYGATIPNTHYYFYIMPSAYYPEIAAHAANDTYILGSNSTRSGIVYTIPLNHTQLNITKDNDGFINIHVPAVLVFNLNNSNGSGYYENVNKTFTADYYAASYKFSYKIASPIFKVSILNGGKVINATYGSGNSNIINVLDAKENNSFLDKLNGSTYSPNTLIWSFSFSNIHYNLEFSSLLNNKQWTGDSIIDYNNTNYTLGSNGYINVPVSISRPINFIDYVFYNTGYAKVVYNNFALNPYNPCTGVTTYQYTLSNVAFINGTITGSVVNNPNQTVTGSSGPPPLPPLTTANLSTIAIDLLKEWGLFFFSLVLIGVIAFKFGIDKKGVQNPQVMAISGILFAGINLFGLAEGLGNIYVTGVMTFLSAIIVFQMLYKLLGPRGS